MLLNLLSRIHRIIRPIIIKGKNNCVSIKTKKRTNFVVRLYGNNNTIEIGNNCRLINSLILISGDNNHLILDDVAKLDGPIVIRLEGNSSLKIGTNSGIRGVKFYIKDGTLSIGKNCMFSYGITIRNNDSHKVLDINGKITNVPGDIIIKDHVWICQDVSIIKGVEIGEISIIGFGSVVTKGCPPNSVLAGNPAKVVKNNINWANK